MLDADLDVRAATPAAVAWLEHFLPPHHPYAELAARAVVCNVASRVLASKSAARVRVRSTAGPWAVVEGERLDPLENTVAVTIRPAAAREVLDLRLLAHDLTRREREIVVAVLDGCDTRAVAERLFLSPHTVQDHLKAIFAKVGVHTRKELVASLATG